MSKRTWVCLACEKTQRREQMEGAEPVACPLCHGACEYVDWKIHIPSPKRRKRWAAFWEVYLGEKRMIADFHADPRIKELKLDLLNKRLRR